MLIIIVLCSVGIVFGEKYPSCPGGVPVDIGNTTDIYYQKMLGLTDFMDYHSQGELQVAFQEYSKTGDSSHVDQIVLKNKTFYIAVLSILGCSSLLLFIIMVRMGNIKLSSKQLFEKIKQHNFSSPLSSFYALVAVILLVSICVTCYLLSNLTTSLQMTQCRLDVLNQAFINGAPHEQWSGIYPYLQKLTQIKQIETNIKNNFASNWTSQNENLFYSSSSLKKLLQQYSGIYRTYLSSQISDPNNSSQKISLLKLIPNIFYSTSNNMTDYKLYGLINYFNMLQESIKTLKLFQYLVQRMYHTFNVTIPALEIVHSYVQQQVKGYSRSYLGSREELSQFFNSASNTLIICQVLVGFTIFGSVISIFTIKLVQKNYDFFSIKVYKIIWACLLVLFCLNLVFLLMFNQIMIYNRGICQVSHQVLTNRTKLSETFPQTNKNNPMYFITQCYFNSNFPNITHTSSIISPIVEYTRLVKKIKEDYTPVKLSSFQQPLQDTVDILRRYQFGQDGVYGTLDRELDFINSITNSNYMNQSCFKHRWQYSADGCGVNQAVGMKPNSVGYLGHADNYDIQVSQCYVLNDYPLSNTPSAHTYNSFYTLYQKYIGQCPYSVHKLATQTVLFFNLYDSRISLFQNLINSLKNLTNKIQNTTSYIITYVNNRDSFIESSFQETKARVKYSYFVEGNQCGIIKHISNGVYNQFCLKFRAVSHQVYLLTVCNICYILLLIVFSLLYAVQLRNITQKDVQQSYYNMQFMRTNMQLSQSQSDLSSSQYQSQQKSTNTHQSKDQNSENN